MLEEGGPCISVYKHKGQRNAELCGLEISHRWYAGPTCKKCYERAGRTGVKQQRRGASEEEEASGGDFLLTVLKVSGVRCAAHPTSAPLPPPLAAHSDSHVVFLCRTSAIPRAFFDRSNPPPETDDDEEELQYDIYGWYSISSRTRTRRACGVSTGSGWRWRGRRRRRAGMRGLRPSTRSARTSWRR